MTLLPIKKLSHNDGYIAISLVLAVAPITAILAYSRYHKERPIEVRSTGRWVVKLSPYSKESTAARKLAQFKKTGVMAEKIAANVHGKTMRRLRVTRFDSIRAAKAPHSSNNNRA